VASYLRRSESPDHKMEGLFGLCARDLQGLNAVDP